MMAEGNAHHLLLLMAQNRRLLVREIARLDRDMETIRASLRGEARRPDAGSQGRVGAAKLRTVG